MITVYNDINYGTHPRQNYDIAFPENAKGNIDLVLYIHGGAWTGGNKSLYSADIAMQAENGIVAATVNYRYMSEDTHCSDMLDDITACLDNIKKFASDKGVNTEKVLLTGVSAGAHLSLLYAWSRQNEASIKPAAAVSLCAPADFYSPEAAEEFFMNNSMGPGMHICSLMSRLTGFEITEENYSSVEAVNALKAVSPIFHINENSVPAVICHGAKDTVVPFINGENLVKKLNSCSIEHEFIIFPNSGHPLDKDPECLRKAEFMLRNYIRTYLKAKED